MKLFNSQKVITSEQSTDLSNHYESSKELLSLTEQLVSKQIKLQDETDDITSYVQQQQEKLSTLIQKREKAQKKSDFIIPVLQKQISEMEIELEQLSKVSKLSEERLVKEKDRLGQIITVEKQKIKEYSRLSEVMIKQVEEIKAVRISQHESILSLGKEIISLTDEARRGNDVSSKLSSIKNKLNQEMQ